MRRGDHHHAAHEPADNLPESSSIQWLLIDSLANHLKGAPLSSTTSCRSGSVWHPSLARSPARFAGLHARLSPDSIYWRYFGFKSALSPAEIRRFTGIAEEWRFALVGVRSTGQLAGVARYEGQAGRTDAEIALIVDDALQHLGLGTRLLRRLVDVAVMSGMTSLTAVVLASNRPMLHLLQALNVPSTSARDSGSIEVRLQLAGLELPADRSRVAAAHVAEAAAIRAEPAS